MIDPPRLLDDTTSTFTRALLRSARRDHGNPSAFMRTMSLVGASAVVATGSATAAAGTSLPLAAAGTFTTTQATTAVASAAAPLAASTVVVTSTATVATLALKSLALGLALGTTVQIAVAAKASVPRPNTSVNVVMRQPVVAAPPHRTALRTPSLVTQAESTPVVESPSLPDGDTINPQRPKLAPTTTSVVTVMSRNNEAMTAPAPGAPFPLLSDETLSREVALLDQARAQCASGQFARALELLDDREHAFPVGVLGPEASLVRVQALLGQERHREARSLALPVIAASPNSVIAKRLTSLLAGSSGER